MKTPYPLYLVRLRRRTGTGRWPSQCKWRAAGWEDDSWVMFVARLWVLSRSGSQLKRFCSAAASEAKARREDRSGLEQRRSCAGEGRWSNWSWRFEGFGHRRECKIGASRAPDPNLVLVMKLDGCWFEGYYNSSVVVAVQSRWRSVRFGKAAMSHLLQVVENGWSVIAHWA